MESHAARPIAPPLGPPAGGLRVLFLVSAHNSLSQRVQIALTELGHAVAVAVVASPEAMEAAVARHRPELIVCPMLKSMIPESIFGRHRCLIVHPGPRGDRGPSSLDWAIELGATEWGVTVLEATAAVDGGDVWATRTFTTRATGKSSLYRHEVRRAAVEAVVRGGHAGRRQAARRRSRSTTATRASRVGSRPLLTQAERAIDWASDPTATVLRRIHAAEGHPGVLDAIRGLRSICSGPTPSVGFAAVRVSSWRSGTVPSAGRRSTGRSGSRTCEAPGGFKLPAARALAVAGVELDVPESPAPLHAPLRPHDTFREIAYDERDGVGYLSFDFYNGAMSTDQCRRLLDAYRFATSGAQTDVIVLMGGRDFFSNGIHLNVIEAADDPAGESWLNLHAIDDLVREIVETDTHLTIAALGG